MHRKRILIVDDDRDTRYGLGLRLASRDYETVAAGDGSAAIRVATRERPDLILLDLGLPQGDGFWVMHELRAVQELAAIPVVVLTCREEKDVGWRVVDSGAQAFLQKPVQNDRLLSTIESTLGRAGSSGSPLSAL